MDTTAIKSLKPLLSMLVVLAAALPGAVDAASDARFFGTYCGTHRVWVDVPGKDQSYDLDIEAYANHYEPRPGQGVVTGRGVAIAKNVGWKLRKDDEDDQGIAEGQRFPFVFSGLVKQRGVLKGSARVAGIEPGSADAFLDLSLIHI